MNEFGTGKVCAKHYTDIIRKYKDVEVYTIALKLDLYTCDHKECNEVGDTLVTIPKEERSNYGKETKPIR